jgi:signal transduction histidine kinase
VAAERLHQAQTMAAVGRLTAGLAHDFNNLLASIILNAEMLAEDLVEHGDLARRIGIILQATNRGAALVRQLLAFSRKQELVSTRVDINEAINAMRDIIHTSIGSTIRLETELEPELGPVMVDLVQIENVLLNLVINARDAMPGGGTLRICTSHERLGQPIGPDDLPAGDYVTVSITDTGTGMTDEVRRNAFDPFFTTKGAGKGSGLGLSQVYGVTRQSGGGVDIISAPGKGTTIRLMLPRAAANEMAG